MATVCEILGKYIDLEPEPGESGREYTIRLAERVAVFEPWKDLPERVQSWYNNVINKVDRRDELLEQGKPDAADEVDIPTVEGFVAVPVERRRPEATDGVGRVRRRGDPDGEPAAAETAPEPEPASGRAAAFPPDTKIILLTDTNPRRSGTKAEKLFRKYKTGVTIADMLKAGMVRRDIYTDRERGSIKFEGDPDPVSSTIAPEVRGESHEELREAPQYHEQGAAADVLVLVLEGIRDMVGDLLKRLDHEDRSQ